MSQPLEQFARSVDDRIEQVKQWLFGIPGPFRPNPRPMRQWVADTALQESLDQALRPINSRLGAMGIALVDLSQRSTDGKWEGFVRYAGRNDTGQRFVASLDKLAVMFAAYHLQWHVQQAVASLHCAKEAVWPTLWAAWEPLVSHRFPHLPQDFPRLEHIFDLRGSPGAWDVGFSNTYTKGNVLWALHREHKLDHNDKKTVNLEHVAQTMGFRDRLRWAVGYHENVAATSVIKDLGQQYIHGALMTEGFCDREGRGIWLGGDYGTGGTPRASQAAKGGTIQSATAAAVADLLTRMDTYLILDSDEAVEDMMHMMQLAGSFFVELGLRPAGRAPSRIYNRVGQQTKEENGFRVVTSASECAVIERVTGRGPPIRYAAVGLAAANEQVLGDLIVKLDDVMQERLPKLYA